MRTLTFLALLSPFAAATDDFFVYEPATSLPVTTLVDGDLKTGDLNGDGFGDFVLSLGNNKVTIALNDGSGGFTTTNLGQHLRPPFDLVDTDGDGMLDLVHEFSPPGDVGIVISRGLGDGTFADAEPIIDLIGAGPSSLSTGDVNGDGFVDVAIAMGSISSITRVFLGAADGTYTELAEPLGGGFAGAFSLSDLDGDGFDDLVFTASSTAWQRSNGDGTFAVAATLVAGNLPPVVANVLDGPAGEIISLKVNNGLRDIIVRGLDGQGAIVELARVTTPFQTSGAAVSAQDINGDGLTDLVLIASRFGHVFRQTPTGTFELAASFTTPNDVGGPAQIIDMDGDGDSDLIFQAPFSDVFVARDATYSGAEPFSDLGGASPGTASFPTQVLSSPNDTVAVSVTSAAPSAPAFVIIGTASGVQLFDSANSPTLDTVIGPLMTSPTGTIMAATASALPPGITIFTQWWIVDDGAPSGFASTSTVKIETP